MRAVTVAVVDDHKLFSRSLEVMINRFRGYSVLFTASDGLDFIHKLKMQLSKPDIVIMDQFMPIMDGSSTVTWLKQNFPEISVIALSMNHSEETVLNMAKNGVKGYLLKDAELTDFKESLDVVSNGGYYYPDYITDFLINGNRQGANQDTEPDSLKPREIEFLKLACSELTYKEIAEKMNVSMRTVDTYRDQLFEKLNIKSRIGLVLYAVKNKLVDPM